MAYECRLMLVLNSFKDLSPINFGQAFNFLANGFIQFLICIHLRPGDVKTTAITLQIQHLQN